MTSYDELVARALQRVDELSSEEVAARLEHVFLVDVREPDEAAAGSIPGSRLIPRGVIEREIGNVIQPDQPVVLYCSAGWRSALAAESLLDMGYHNVSSLRGGFDEWKARGLPWGDPTGLTTDQRTRYARHVSLPEVGEDGQLRLLDARVLIIGAGGLGSPVGMYLAAAGIGTIGIVDHDRVDPSNLQRQVIHNLDRVGMSKVESAGETIKSLNPDVKLELHQQQLSASNAVDLLSSYDVVVDCTDNFPTRYLVNDAALNAGVPVVHGSIFRFEGQVTVFDSQKSACYRCVHPVPPPPSLAPNCVEGGVLGVLPGVVGTIQAMEAIKVVLGIGEPLIGRLLIYDALDQDFTLLALNRDSDCPACGTDTPPTVVDYDDTCRSPLE